MTKCLVRTDFFETFNLLSEDDTGLEVEDNQMEFLLPFAEIKAIFDTLSEESNTLLHIKYPVGDGKLELEATEYLRNMAGD